MTYVLVFLGGGAGSVLRHIVNLLSARFLGASFPWGTMTVNVTGSLIMGLLAGYFAFRGDAGNSMRLLLMTGVLGGYTTFSAFSLDTMLLYERGLVGMAAAYAGMSVVLSVGALAAGLGVAKYFS